MVDAEDTALQVPMEMLVPWDLPILLIRLLQGILQRMLLEHGEEIIVMQWGGWAAVLSFLRLFKIKFSLVVVVVQAMETTVPILMVAMEVESYSFL